MFGWVIAIADASVREYHFSIVKDAEFTQRANFKSRKDHISIKAGRTVVRFPNSQEGRGT